MNRLVRGMSVLVIVAGMVAAASTARADVPDEWKSLDVAGLTALAQQFAAQGADGVDNCKALAGYVAERYATDSAAGQVDWNQWLDLAISLGPYYPAATQTAMGTGIQQNLAPNEAAILQLTGDKLKKVGASLSRLGRNQAASSVCSTWTNGTTAWQSWGSHDLRVLAAWLIMGGDAGKPARLRLTGHVTSKYLADEAAMKSVPIADWRGFAEYLGRDLSADNRRLWADKICDVFAKTPEAMAALKEGEPGGLIRALKALDSGREVEFSVMLVNGTTVWKIQDSKALACLAEFLADSGVAGKDARRRLAEHIKATYLKDKASVQSVRRWYWRRYVLCLGNDLTDEDRKLWAGKLREAFTSSPEDMSKLTPRQFWFMAYAVSTLDAGEAPPMVLAWFNANKDNGFDAVSSLDLARIANVGKADKVGMAPVMNQFDTIWLARYNQGPLKSKTLYYIIDAWRVIGNRAKTQVWTMRAYEAALGTDEGVASVDANGLKLLGQMLLQAGLTGKGKEYPAFAVALARLAGQDKIPADKWWRYQYYAAPLGTPQMRQTLQSELTDAEDNPRLVVARILAGAYRDAADRNNWLAFLDGKIAAPGISGDTKARWLIARAWAESIIPSQRSPLRGKNWLEQVLDVAKSSSLRIAAIEQLALGYAAAHKYAEGAVFLNSAAKRFTDAQTAAAIEALCAEHIESEVKYLTMRISLVRRRAAHLDNLAKVTEDEKRKNIYIRWAKYFGEREKEFLAQLEQIEQ